MGNGQDDLSTRRAVRPPDRIARLLDGLELGRRFRSGGRDVADVRKAITDIYQRNVEGWEEDNDFFTRGRKRNARKVVKTSKPAKTPKATRKKKTSKKKTSGKRAR